ncbi:MAG: TonB-dependent siderophore receptor [Gammaproteobacteria bacterium]
MYRDGLRHIGSITGIGPLGTANLDRIEVLKGPASILFGRIEPGGLINLVSKQPLATPYYYSLQQQVGSFDLYRTTLDATGPVTKDETLLYRVNLAYENAGSFIEFLENERVFIAPTLRWEISPATQATFELQYKHSRDPRFRGIPAIGDRPADLPRERNLSEPGSDAKSDDVLFSFDWSHAFNDRWTLRHSFYGDWTDGSSSTAGIGSLDADGRTGIWETFSSHSPPRPMPRTWTSPGSSTPGDSGIFCCWAQITLTPDSNLIL